MKLAPVNGVNVCELVFVPDMDDVISSCFKVQTGGNNNYYVVIEFELCMLNECREKASVWCTLQY